jgi:phenol/toluene 2-monooxygenase (NADH) P0/A0
MTERQDRIGGAEAAEAAAVAAGPDLSRRFVRVTGRRGPFVELEFAIGDPELHVDLVLPAEVFAEFCRANAVEMLEGAREPDARDWSMRRAALGAVPKRL